MTKTLTTRRVFPLLLSLVSAILLLLLLAPTASAATKTYTVSGTGTKTKTLTVPKGYYQATFSWSNNGKEQISFDVGDTKSNLITPYVGTSYTTKKGKYSESFYSSKKQKYEFSVTAAKKGKWKITLKPIKATTKLEFSGKDSKTAYVKVPKGVYKLNYTYSNNEPKGSSFLVATFMDEKVYTKASQIIQQLNYDELDYDELDLEGIIELAARALDSVVISTKTSGKGTKTIIVEKDSYFLFDIQALIIDPETGATKPNHNVKWSFKLEPIKL